MSSAAVDLSAGLTPKPPMQQSEPIDLSGGLVSAGTPITDSSTIEAPPQSSFIQKAGHALDVVSQIPTNALGLAKEWSESDTPNADLTQEGKAEHPWLAGFGEITSRAKELMRMVQPEAELLGGSVGGEEAAAETAGAAKTEAELASEGNRLLKTTPKSFAGKVEPGRAIVRESVDPKAIESANNARLAKDPVAEEQHMQVIKKHLDTAIQNLKEQQTVLLKHPTGEGIDLRPIIEESYQKALNSAKETGSPEIVKAINKAHEEMVKIPNEDGELIADRYLNHSAEETAEETQKVKQTFQGRSNYNSAAGGQPDTPTLEANKLWKDVASKVRSHIEDRVPGIADVNSRLRDASSAAKLAEKRILTLKGKPALPSAMQRFTTSVKNNAPSYVVKGAAGTVGAEGAYQAYKHFLSGE